MPSKARGEVELKLDGRTYVLRPSFEIMSAIEDATEKGTIELLTQIQNQTVKMKDVVASLWIAAKRSKNRDVPTIERFGENIRSEFGLVEAWRVLRDFLGVAVSTDKQLEEAEAKIAAEEEEDTKDSDPSEELEEEVREDKQPE